MKALGLWNLFLIVVLALFIDLLPLTAEQKTIAVWIPGAVSAGILCLTIRRLNLVNSWVEPIKESLYFFFWFAVLFSTPHALTGNTARMLISNQLWGLTMLFLIVVVGLEVAYTIDRRRSGDKHWKMSPLLWGPSHKAVWRMVFYFVQIEGVLKLSDLATRLPTLAQPTDALSYWIITISNQFAKNGYVAAEFLAALLPIYILANMAMTLRSALFVRLFRRFEWKLEIIEQKGWTAIEKTVAVS